MLQLAALVMLLGAVVPIPARPLDYVSDTGHVLSATTADRLRTELQSYESATGHHLMVYIGTTTGDAPLEDWTIRAASAWKVGRKGKDDGAILFMFMTDHKVRIEVGYGLESKLTDAQSSEIIRNTIVPKMRANDPDAAVSDGVERMMLTITPNFANRLGHAPPSTSSSSDWNNIGVFVVIGLIFLVFIILWIVSMVRYAVTYARKGPKAAKALANHGGWYFGPGMIGMGGSSGGGGGFSGSFGGGFGGGGASGSW